MSHNEDLLAKRLKELDDERRSVQQAIWELYRRLDAIIEEGKESLRAIHDYNTSSELVFFFESSTVRESHGQPRGISRVVKEAVKLTPLEVFAAEDLLLDIERLGLAGESSVTTDAVRKVLARLAKDETGMIEVVQYGVGPKPHRYGRKPMTHTEHKPNGDSNATDTASAEALCNARG